MSASTGGFFFSNPTPLPVNPQDPRDGEQQTPTNTNVTGGYGVNTNAGLVVNNTGGVQATGTGLMVNNGSYNMVSGGAGDLGASMAQAGNNLYTNVSNPPTPTNQQQQQAMNNGGQIFLNNGVNNVNMMASNVPVNNMGTIGINSNNPGAVLQNTANASTGFGSFFFNPLAQLFGNGQNAVTSNTNVPLVNNDALGNTTNGIVINPAMLDPNLLAMLQQQQQMQQQQNQQGIQVVPQPQQQQQQVQNQQNFQPLMTAQQQIQATTMSPALNNNQTQFIDTSNQLITQQHQQRVASNKSPHLAFLTPNQGPTPCPPTPPTPMFHDANSTMVPDMNLGAAGNTCNVANYGSLGNNSAVVAQANAPNTVAATITREMQQELQKDTTTAVASSKSWGITSLMGSALGAVATYVNQSFLSGIPFHIADRAMKESKATYAKWWEDGINDTVAEHEKKRRKGSTDDEADLDDSSDEGNVHHLAKKQKKLDRNGKGSALSVSLKEHYDDMGIDTECKFVECRQAEQFQQYNPTTQQQVASSSFLLQHQSGSMIPAIEVDTSIIKPRHRRSQFEKKRKAVELHPDGRLSQKAKSTSKTGSSSAGGRISGYNAFNDIGGLYDFGGDSDDGDNNHGEEGEAEKASSITEPLTYDSLGGYYMTNGDDGVDNGGDNNDKEDKPAASSATNPKMVSLDGTKKSIGHTASATITSFSDHDNNNNAPRSAVQTSTETTTRATANTATAIAPTPLDGTLRVISELLEEKNRVSEENEMLQMLANPRDWVKKSVRSELIESLQKVRGDVKDKRFLGSLDILSNFYKTSGRDARVSPWAGRRSVDDPGIDGGAYGYSGSEIGGPTSSDLLEGNWVNMSRPNYVECLGNNAENDFLYTLGRMSFDMFQPGNLICSVQSTHNTIKIIGEREELPSFVPKSLREEVASLCDSGRKRAEDSGAKRPLLRSYE